MAADDPAVASLTADILSGDRGEAHSTSGSGATEPAGGSSTPGGDESTGGAHQEEHLPGVGDQRISLRQGLALGGG